jgi:hypothetical protein
VHADGQCVVRTGPVRDAPPCSQRVAKPLVCDGKKELHLDLF